MTIDPSSNTWAVVKAHVARRISECQTQLEDETADDRLTANTRGRIAELRSLLALADPVPVIPAGKSHY